MKRELILFLLFLLALGCAGRSKPGRLSFEPQVPKDMSAILKHPLGSNENPVRCEGPRGERAYIERLRCPNGGAPTYRRLGSFAPGPYKMILDGYELSCTLSDETRTIFLDMYHRGHVEKKAIPGFTIVPPPPPPEDELPSES